MPTDRHLEPAGWRGQIAAARVFQDDILGE
jgi:hypothetical protein